MKSAFFAVLFFCTGAYALAQSIMLPGPGLGVTPPSGNSLIFTAASSQYLTATGKTNINQQKSTFATWVKLAATGSTYALYWSGDGSANNEYLIQLNVTNVIEILAVTSGSNVAQLITSSGISDTNWHHLLVGVDTTQATAANRIAIYLDGSLITSFTTSNYPTQNTNLSNNFAATYAMGRYQPTPSEYLNGKLAQIYYIDGQQLTPSSFITGTPGVPKTYSGTYTGHFDFFLPFSNGTSTTTLGADSSGESNNWTLNNMTTANQSTDYP